MQATAATMPAQLTLQQWHHKYPSNVLRSSNGDVHVMVTDPSQRDQAISDLRNVQGYRIVADEVYVTLARVVVEVSDEEVGLAEEPVQHTDEPVSDWLVSDFEPLF